MTESSTAPTEPPKPPSPSTPTPAAPSPAPSAPAPPTGGSGIESLFAAWWPRPGEPAWWVAAAAGGVGLLAALLVPDVPRAGVNLTVCGLAAAVPAALSSPARRRGRAALALAAVTTGLLLVPTVRASEWLVAGCLCAAVCLGTAIVLDARRWAELLAAPALFGVAALRSLPWVRRSVRVSGLRGNAGPWVSGLAVGGVCTVVVAGLLASADDAFADLVSALSPSLDADTVFARFVVLGFGAWFVVAAVFAASARRPALPRRRAVAAVARPAAGWMIPLVLVGVTIAAFLAVEATVLFGGAEVAYPAGSPSHADRARQGFGQLTVVTLIVVGLLAWAARRAAGGPPPHRRLMGGAGGALLVLALLLAVSALRRLWLYQDEYGWTVTRLNGGAFEIWVVAVLLGTAACWLRRRTDLLPRLVAGSAGLGLLAVTLAGPDALVARADVERFESTGRIDTYYLSTLSPDAVPALDRLPEPFRSCALAGAAPSGDPWPGWNLARSRADRILDERPPGPCTDVGEGTGTR